MADTLRLTWADFDRAIDTLARIVRGEQQETEYSGIYGVPRGGLPIAVALSHATGLPVQAMADDRSLVVDDITDAGSTLVRFPANKRLVWVRRHASRARASAALYLPEGDDRWVLFPWERAENAGQDKAAYASRAGAP